MLFRNMICFLIILTLVNSQELPSPSNQLAPRNFNYHSQQLCQYLEEVSPAPTKQGPVLFPNDAPPPPRPPLVVTSRPLTESIARSELNNSIADSSYINPVTYRPSYDINYNNFESTNRQAVPRHHNDISSEQDYSEGQNYAFSYIVKDQKTGDDFSHKQQSIGSATNGEYRVRLPDGRLQIVSYTADDNGYNANVRYDDSHYLDNSNTNNYDTNKNYADTTNYNIQNDYNKVNTNYKINNNVDNTHYDFSKINYRDEIPVKENQYDSKEYYDYSAENYKNPEPIYNPGSTANPYSVSTTVAPFLQFQNNYQTTTAPFLQFQNNYHTTTVPFQQNYQPTTGIFQQNYQSTLSPFKETYPTTAPFIPSSTVKPSYDEIKHLFTTPNYNNIEVNSPSSYTDNVVLIGAKNHYTDYNSNGDNRDNSLVISTPTPYVLSSLRNLNDRINTKPVLSDGYIDRINKYLSFK